MLFDCIEEEHMLRTITEHIQNLPKKWAETTYKYEQNFLKWNNLTPDVKITTITEIYHDYEHRLDYLMGTDEKTMDGFIRVLDILKYIGRRMVVGFIESIQNFQKAKRLKEHFARNTVYYSLKYY